MDQQLRLQRKQRPYIIATTSTPTGEEVGDDTTTTFTHPRGGGGTSKQHTTTTTTTRRSRRMIIVVLITLILLIIVLRFQMTWNSPHQYFFYYDDGDTTKTRSSSSSSSNANANITTTTTTTLTNTKVTSSSTTTQQQQQQQQSQSQQRPRPSKIIYSNIRYDRSGAAIQDMLMCHAYVYHLNKQTKQNNNGGGSIVYGGACGQSEYIDDYNHLINGIGLSNMLPFACPNRRNSNIPTEIIVDRSTYQTPEDIRIFTLDYIQHVQQNYILPYFQKQQKLEEQQQEEQLQQKSDTLSSKDNNSNDNSSGYYDYIIAVHVRRGDITPCCWETRYLPNSHYIQLIQRSIDRIAMAISDDDGSKDDRTTTTTGNTRIRVVIFSESSNNTQNNTAVESFDEFRTMMNFTFPKVRVDVDIVLDGDPVYVWKTMILRADICIVSKSSFSLVPAIFNIPTTQRAIAISKAISNAKATSSTTTTTTSDSSTRGHVLYTPPYIHRPLQYWDIVEDSQLKQQSKKIVHQLKKQYCSGVKCSNK